MTTSPGLFLFAKYLPVSLRNCVIATAMFPFLGSTFGSSDVQPYAPILATIYMFIVTFGQKRVSLSTRDVSLFFLTFTGIFFITLAFGRLPAEFTFGMLLGYFFFLFALREKPLINERVLFVSFAIYALVALGQTLSPDLIGEFVTGLLSRHVDASNSRGVSSLTPEPGYLSSISLFFFIALHKVGSYKNNKKLLAALCLLILCFYLAKSAQGPVFFCVIYGIFFICRKRSLSYKFFPYLLLFLFAFFLIRENLNLFSGLGRISIGLDLVFDLNTGLLVQDASIGHRLKNLVVAAYTFLEYPAGLGDGAFVDQSRAMTEQLNFYWFPNANSPVSSMANGIISFGIFYIMWVYLIFIRIGFKLNQPAFMLGLIFMTFSFSVVFPLTYLAFALLSVGVNKNHRKKRNFRRIPLLET